MLSPLIWGTRQRHDGSAVHPPVRRRGSARRGRRSACRHGVRGRDFDRKRRTQWMSELRHALDCRCRRCRLTADSRISEDRADPALFPVIHWTCAAGADWRWFYSGLLSNIGQISDAAVTVEAIRFQF